MKFTVAPLLAATLFTGPAVASIIDTVTTPAFTNGSYAGLLFTSPSGAPSLTSFTILAPLPSSIPWPAYPEAWDGTEATGPGLDQSATYGTTGGVAVSGGTTYVFFPSASGLAGSGNEVRPASSPTGPGRAVFLDGAFPANVPDGPSVPESSTVSLAIAGYAAVRLGKSTRHRR